MAGLFCATILLLSACSTPSSVIAVLAGAVGAMLPAPLHFVHTLYPHEPLPHSSASIVNARKAQLAWPNGVSSRVAFVATVVGTSLAIF
jgi:hypothetical protein